MSNAFSVKVRDFEGPLDLLLNLIEDRKMLINDVSITNVADDFLKFIQGQNTFPLGQAAHFVYVSATLLLLKSRSLLPVLSLTDEEEGDVKDLEFRLTILQVMRAAGKLFPNGTARMFFGSGAKVEDPVFMPSKDLSLSSIQDAINRVLANAPKETKLSEVSVASVMSLEEMIDRLSERIQKAMHMTFSTFAGTATDKREVVVGFLAMLELVKRGMLLVEQEKDFAEIRMNYAGNLGAPRYD